MKASRRRSDNVLTMPPANAAAAPATVISEDQIATRAFELYCARGREDGHDLEDWLQAERELSGSERTDAA